MKKIIVKDSKTAVVAILVYNGKVLFLKRTSPPLNWCPPCGRAKMGENLEEALIREVREETGLTIEIIKFVYQWKGLHDGEKIKSFTFVCSTNSDMVVLSDEHSDYAWVNIEDIGNWSDKTDFSVQNWPEWILD